MNPRYASAATSSISTWSTALVIGIPTDVLPNPWFGREICVRALDVIVLVALSAVTGALLATYAVAGAPAPGPRVRIGSGIIGWFAIGCPVCNKLVVTLLGVSGATSTFAPVQPVLGVAAVALATTALVIRVRAIRRGECPLPAGNHSSPTASGLRPDLRRGE